MTKLLKSAAGNFRTVVVVLAALFGAAVAVSCDDGSSPKLCTCPNGTIHEVGPCSCGGIDCACKWLNYGITLEDQTNGALTGAHIDMLNIKIGGLKDFYGYNTVNVKIIVTTGGGSSENGNELTIGLSEFDNDPIFGAILDTFLEHYTQSLSFMPDRADDFNANTRLANGKTLNTMRLAESGGRFAAVKETAPGRAAFQHRGRQA